MHCSVANLIYSRSHSECSNVNAVIFCFFIANDGPGSRRPSGGHGGEGGDVYIIADKKLR
jgi:hypothetical protein